MVIIWPIRKAVLFGGARVGPEYDGKEMPSAFTVEIVPRQILLILFSE